MPKVKFNDSDENRTQNVQHINSISYQQITHLNSISNDTFYDFLLSSLPDNVPSYLFIHELKDDGQFSKPNYDHPVFCLKTKEYLILENICRGLFCFVDYKGHQVLVCNPLTKQTLNVPSSMPILADHLVPYSYGLGYTSSTNSYKVVSIITEKVPQGRFYYTLTSLKRHVLVHTLGTSSWRAISSRLPYPTGSKPVYAYEALHWIVDHRVYNRSKGNIIVSFSIANEEFYMIPCPWTVDRSLVFSCLFVIGESLAFAAVVSNERNPNLGRMDIFVLKNHERQEWGREYVIGIDPLANLHREVIGHRRDGVIVRDEGQLSFYQRGINKLMHRRIVRVPSGTDYELICCNGSLLSLMNVGEESIRNPASNINIELS